MDPTVQMVTLLAEGYEGWDEHESNAERCQTKEKNESGMRKPVERAPEMDYQPEVYL